MGYVWITKDDKAKKAHAATIHTSGISVVWVRGIDRSKKQGVNIHDVHHLLTAKLEEAAKHIEAAHGPIHHEVYLNALRPALRRIDDQQVDPNRPLRAMR